MWKRNRHRPAASTAGTLLGACLSAGEGNRWLTATTAVLLVLLSAESAALLTLRPLLSLHVFLGMLLIPSVALKLASTGCRFARYYARDAAAHARADGCWTKVGLGKRSLPLTVDNFLKPWFFIYIRHGRVDGFRLTSKFVD